MRERIVHFLEEPTFARTLSVPHAAVQRAMTATFQACAASAAAQQASGRYLQLVFRHACQCVCLLACLLAGSRLSAAACDGGVMAEGAASQGPPELTFQYRV